MKHSTIHEKKFVAPRQLAEEWQVSVSTVLRILKREKIPLYYLGRGRNGTVRVRRADVDRYLEKCKT